MIMLNKESVVREEKVTNVFYHNLSRIKYSERPTSCSDQPWQSAFRRTQPQNKEAWKLLSEFYVWREKKNLKENISKSWQQEEDKKSWTEKHLTGH